MDKGFSLEEAGPRQLDERQNNGFEKDQEPEAGVVDINRIERVYK